MQKLRHVTSRFYDLTDYSEKNPLNVVYFKFYLYVCFYICAKKRILTLVDTSAYVEAKVFLLIYFMKVFITNKEHFDSSFKTTNQIHKDLYSEVMSNVAHGFIPLCVVCDYSDNSSAVFDFISKKGDILFYQFSTTVSL